MQAVRFFDITTGEWSDELLKIFNVPRAMLPQVRPSSGIFGDVDDGWLGASIPIAGCAGDQQSSAFAHGCVEAGDAKTTYGTGAFLLESTGTKPVLDAKGLLATPGVRLDLTWHYNRTALRVRCLLQGHLLVGYATARLIERSNDIEHWLKCFGCRWCCAGASPRDLVLPLGPFCPWLNCRPDSFH